MPTVLAVGLVAILLTAHAPRADLSLRTLSDAVVSLRLMGWSAVVAVAGAISVTMQPLQFRLVQLLEGYWPSRMSLVFRLGTWHQARRRERLVSQLTTTRSDAEGSRARVSQERRLAAETLLRERFPLGDRLLPTTLGNVLRSAEDRLGKRYGFESVVIWPRLFPLLPREFAQGVEDEVTQLDVSARLVLTWAGAGLVGSALLLKDLSSTRQHPGWVLVVAGLWFLAWVSYRAAIESALAHGQDIEIALDLFRDLVIEAMRLPEPRRLSQERDMFGRLCTLFQTYRLDPSFDLSYRRPARSPSR